MKQIEVGTEGCNAKLKQAPPLLPPPLPKLWTATKQADETVVTASVTNQEIAKFWRQKRMEEEDHLLSAIKAAARIRARKLTEEDYRRFEESLEEDDDSKASDAAATATTSSGEKDEESVEFRVGIKDWWTKSKYAYLNQPAAVVESMDKRPKRATSTYIPNLCNYKPAPPPTTSFGIF